MLQQPIYFVICVIEAKLEQYVIKGKKVDIDKSIDDLEHRWSAVYSVTVGIALMSLLAYHIRDWKILFEIPSMLLIRRIGFDFPLKKFKKIPTKIITGNRTIDNLSRKIFGTEGGIKELITWIILLATFDYLIYKFL